MSSNARSKSNDEITKKVFALLKEIVDSPGQFRRKPSLLLAVATQPGLSRLKDVERGIRARSVNTVVRSADRCLPGGYAEFDAARIEAAKALGVETRTERVRINKVWQEAEFKKLEASLRHSRQDLWHVTAVLNRSMQQARHYASKSGDPSLIKLCEREQKELHAALTLLQDKDMAPS